MKIKFILLILFLFLKFQLFSKEKQYNMSLMAYKDIRIDTSSKAQFYKVKNLYQKKKYPVALQNGLLILEKNINDSLRIETEMLIAEIYRRVNNYKNSISYFRKVLQRFQSADEFSEKLNFDLFREISKSKIYLRLGGLYFRIGQRDSSKFYYNKVVETNSINNENLSYKASAFINLSGIFMEEKRYDMAKIYVDSAIYIHQTVNNKISQASALGSLASIYLEENKYSKAKETYKKALGLIEKEKGDRALRARETLYFNLAYNLYILKDYEAYNYQELSYEIKDTLRDKEIRTMIEEFAFKYDFEAKKELLQKVEENKRLIQEKKFWFSLGTSFVIIIFLTFCVMFYHQRKKTLALQLEKADFIQKQKIDTYKSELQTKVLNATIDGKESERKEIAESLHDNVSALLSSANLHLQASKKHFDEKIPEEIYKSQQIINEASKKVRDLSHNLVSSILLKFGLSFAIRDIVGKYSNSSLKINSDVENVGRYNQKFEIKTFNIIQEFLNNILKHSKAKEANVFLKEENNNIVIKISDNGIGFDKSKIIEKDGLGINQIKARIKIMKGNFYLQTKKGSGTEIKVVLPVQEKMEEVSA